MSNSRCPNKEICGSCTWSVYEYEKQLELKLKGINEALQLNNVEYNCKKIIPSPVTSHYRNKMDFVINFEGKVGLREKGKWWKVIDNHPCFISDENIEDVFYKVRDWVAHAGLSFHDRKKNIGLLRYAVIRSNKHGDIMLNIVTSIADEKDKQIIEAFKTLLHSVDVYTLIWSQSDSKSDVSFGERMEILSGPGYLIEEIGGFRFKISPNAFFQTNPYSAETLMNVVEGMIENVEAKNVLDLYCGTGFFSMLLSKKFGSVLGIEIVEDAIEDAIKNATLNNSPATFKAEKAEDLSWKGSSWDLILVDPPRAGLGKSVLNEIMENSPKYLLYISCKYESFSKELKILLDKYSVVDMYAVDMFPHTPHVELVTLLKMK